jgi:quercetin dioxygenase-like cupin family protein
MTATMKLYHWDRVEKEAMNPSLARQVIHGEKMTVARIHLRKGGIVPLHHHVNEQLSIVERGKLRFTAGGEVTVMSPGDMLMIPANVPHTVEALEDSVAVDINSPVREDWLRGDDAYLRK